MNLEQKLLKAFVKYMLDKYNEKYNESDLLITVPDDWKIEYECQITNNNTAFDVLFTKTCKVKEVIEIF